MPVLETLKRYRKINKKDRFLKQLVQVYANPWSKRRGTFRDYEKNHGNRDARITEERFAADLQATGLPTPGNTLAAPAESARKETLERVLNRLIDPALIPVFYDYDFLDDIVPIVESRYITPSGVSDKSKSGHILQVLWSLCGQSGDYEPQKLPKLMRRVLGDNHGYVPARHQQREVLEKMLPPDMVEDFIRIKSEEERERYLEINTEIFRFINNRATDKYEERDISLIYGYENNHHLMLRTLIGLISEGKITPEDEVLVIGPRYVDEILFFREILGLKKTIGLDLRSEDGLLFEGDMHEIPFPDNHFKLIYGANVFEYAYNLRRVVDEMARVLKRPGYVSAICRSNRTQLPSPTGRSDVGNVDAATDLFYQHPHTILAKDAGLTSNPDSIGNFPSFIVELKEGHR